MGDKGHNKRFALTERSLSVVVFALLFSWMLAFPFEGQILYSLTGEYGLTPDAMILSAVAVHCAGLFLCGFLSGR